MSHFPLLQSIIFINQCPFSFQMLKAIVRKQLGVEVWFSRLSVLEADEK